MKDSGIQPQFRPNPKARVLVAGDVMLDRYVHGAATRISPEAPVPVVHVSSVEERPGGAANVAVNIKRLGIAVRLAGVTGTDSDADHLANRLSALGIEARLQRLPGVATVVKTRVLSQHQQLIRLDYEAPVPKTQLAALAEIYKGLMEDVDCVVLSDYAKGALDCASDVIDAARKRSLPALVDPKARDFGSYRGATILTPNSREFEAVAGSWQNDGELEAKSRRLCADLQIEALLVTRGEAGMTLIRPGSGNALHLPACAHEVYDVTGAGDTVIGVLAAALVSGFTLEDSVRLANAAAGIVVQKLGTASVSVEELNAPAGPGPRRQGTILGLGELEEVIATARRRGERIVMTNGCFDILHPGHVRYLEAAKALGNRLLVAVNDDDSVRRLKGAGRPVNTLADRMCVLSGLAAIDWVSGFSGDTPEELIRRVAPDVLVKGGDYEESQIAGAKWVREHGGEVRILPYVQGSSTSSVIDGIRASKPS